jgi:atypical dual specificity phosphatase
MNGLWWIAKGRLAGCRKPTLEDLPVLQSLGIQSIVSLLDDEENLSMYKSNGLSYLWLPVKGGTAPTIEQVQNLKRFIDSQSCGTIVHCSNGRRRTGTLLAAYLIASGKTFEEAYGEILQSNPTVDLREDQTRFLQDLAASLRK